MVNVRPKHGLSGVSTETWVTAGTTAVFSHCRLNLLQCDCPGSQRRTDGSRPPKARRNLLFHQHPQRIAFKDSFFSFFWLHSTDRHCGANSSSTAHFIIRISPVGEFCRPPLCRHWSYSPLTYILSLWGAFWGVSGWARVDVRPHFGLRKLTSR